MDSGYARGLKAGSFNYLDKGDINFEEAITYTYGNGTPKANSTYTHDMNLAFKGEKGISEFYGAEYFKNNRAVAAWKKIRYDKIKKEYKNLGESRMASAINVTSALSMDTTPWPDGTGYDLKYGADVKNGVANIYDSTGWSNRTGARRIDWEYAASMQGDISFRNDLKELAPQEAHGGEFDWLPCFCISGTQPPIEQLDKPWPTQDVINTLEANRILPQSNCTSGECKGDECTYDQGGLQSGFLAYNESATGMRIVQEYSESADIKEVAYSITISNSGDVRIRSVTVDDILPANMAYIDSSFRDIEDNTLAEPRQLKNPDGTTTLSWPIGDLNSGDNKIIRLRVRYTGGTAEFTANKVKAIGSAAALGTIIETEARPATQVLEGGVG
jgi:uncharacterized repeat protein (TIGR01451 family)